MESNWLPLVEDLPTPFYLYDVDGIISRIELIKGLMPQVDFYFAVKANSNLELLREMRPYLHGLDISSGGELDQSLLAGYSGRQCSFAGPGKTVEEVEKGLDNQCGTFSIESMDDYGRIRDAASRKGMKAPVLLRINPEKVNKSFAIKMGGRATQFGIDQENALPLLEELSRDEHIDFRGYHIYSGTQNLNAQGLVEYYENNLEVIFHLVEESGMKPAKVNLGGGFGIPYYQGNEPLNVEEVAQGINRVVEAFYNAYGCRTIIELGRFLVGEFGYYLARVLARKSSRGKEFLITDGGMHHNLAASGNLGQVIRKNYHVDNISSSREVKNYDLAGCLCTPLDILGTNLSLAQADIGDLILIPASGAYGYSASPLLFLGHETPGEYALKGGTIRQIRKSFSLTDFN
jgi:diaminopimelate decarboxylase